MCFSPSKWIRVCDVSEHYEKSCPVESSIWAHTERVVVTVVCASAQLKKHKFEFPPDCSSACSTNRSRSRKTNQLHFFSIYHYYVFALTHFFPDNPGQFVHVCDFLCCCEETFPFSGRWSRWHLSGVFADQLDLFHLLWPHRNVKHRVWFWQLNCCLLCCGDGFVHSFGAVVSQQDKSKSKALSSPRVPVSHSAVTDILLFYFTACWLFLPELHFSFTF